MNTCKIDCFGATYKAINPKMELNKDSIYLEGGIRTEKYKLIKYNGGLKTENERYEDGGFFPFRFIEKVYDIKMDSPNPFHAE